MWVGRPISPCVKWPPVALLVHEGPRWEIARSGTATALSSLSQDYLLGALTNGNADVHKTPIARYFNHAWRAEEFGISKPDPLLFHRVFEQAGVSASEVIHVGDCHNNDVAGAIAAGARAVWFSPDGGNSDIADAIVTRLADLPSVIKALASTKPA